MYFNQDANLADLLQWTVLLMFEQPASMVPAFDSQYGIACVFKLLASQSEQVRIHALKLLGFFLWRSTPKYVPLDSFCYLVLFQIE